MVIKPYTLLIKPVGGDCNLRCSYCFYLRTLDRVYANSSRHRMNEETLRRLVASYMGEGFRVSAFCWQGGEPLLAGLPFYEQVIEFQKRYGGDGRVVSNAFQTNATLIDENWARFFSQYRCLVGVSVDGPEYLNDTYRLNAGGRGTHARVLDSIKILRDHQVEFNALCVVNKHTSHHAAEILHYFQDMGIQHLQFIPIVERDEKTGQMAEFVMTPEEYGTFLCELWDEWTRPGIPQVSIRDFEAWLERMLGAAPPLCSHDSACNQYVMIEHNGDVYPCDFYCNPSYKLGNLVETPLPAIYRSAKHRGFATLKAVYPDECYACPWLDLCHGGCPKDRMQGSTDSGKPSARHSNYLCDAFRMFFSHAYPKMVELKNRIWAMETGAEMPGNADRNAACPCGSGRKYKHCCGRGR
mgnify:CR=1 FL=1